LSVKYRLFNNADNPVIRPVVKPEGAYKYQDIRDDRVFIYFDIPRGGSKTISFIVNRAYDGSFYSSPVRAYAMYDESIMAVRKQ
jgi:uncharacterized protein YfaS (alpha-2-macroglobulin family)